VESAVTYGVYSDEAYARWQNACFVYLRFVFARAPKSAIIAAAAEVLKWSHMVRHPGGRCIEQYP
jgi:hypothetical protein